MSFVINGKTIDIVGELEKLTPVSVTQVGQPKIDRLGVHFDYVNVYDISGTALLSSIEKTPGLARSLGITSDGLISSKERNNTPQRQFSDFFISLFDEFGLIDNSQLSKRISWKLSQVDNNSVALVRSMIRLQDTLISSPSGYEVMGDVRNLIADVFSIGDSAATYATVGYMLQDEDFWLDIDADIDTGFLGDINLDNKARRERVLDLMNANMGSIFATSGDRDRYKRLRTARNRLAHNQLSDATVYKDFDGNWMLWIHKDQGSHITIKLAIEDCKVVLQEIMLWLVMGAYGKDPKSKLAMNGQESKIRQLFQAAFTNTWNREISHVCKCEGAHPFAF